MLQPSNNFVKMYQNMIHCICGVDCTPFRLSLKNRFLTLTIGAMSSYTFLLFPTSLIDYSIVNLIHHQISDTKWIWWIIHDFVSCTNSTISTYICISVEPHNQFCIYLYLILSEIYTDTDFFGNINIKTQVRYRSDTSIDTILHGYETRAIGSATCMLVTQEANNKMAAIKRVIVCDGNKQETNSYTL